VEPRRPVARRCFDWESFYSELHERPEPRTYARTYAPDVDVTDRNGRWRPLREWSAHEREAILLGVHARIVGRVASRDVTVLEIDFTNPDWAAEHCPPRSTFVHRLADGRSRRLDIHYVCDAGCIRARSLSFASGRRVGACVRRAQGGDVAGTLVLGRVGAGRHGEHAS